MASARPSSELLTDSLDGVRCPSSVRTTMRDNTISVDCDGVANAEVESRQNGNSAESRRVEFSDDCMSDTLQKIPGASKKEGLGHRLVNDVAVPRSSAALPSDNAGSVKYVDKVVPPQATESVVDYDGGETCPLYSDGVLTPGDSTELGAVPPSVIDSYAVAPPVPSLRDRRARERLSHIIGTDDDNSQFADESMQKVTMDEFGYIYDVSDSDYDEFSVDEDSYNAGGISIADTDVDNSAASGTIEKEIDDRKVRNNFVSQTVDFTNSADYSGTRPRRVIRRPRRYDDFETQFTR